MIDACESAIKEQEEIIKLSQQLADSLIAAYDRWERENAQIKTYHNKRVVHLALYHPISRVRNINRRRILKDIGVM